MTFTFDSIAGIAAFFAKQAAHARKQGEDPRGKTKSQAVGWIREASTYEAVVKILENTHITFNEEAERKAFEIWAADNWPNSAPPDNAWLGWKAAKGGK